MRGLAVPRTPPEPALLDVVRDLFVAIPLPLSFGNGFGAAGAAAAGARQQQQQPQRRHRRGGSVAASDGGLRDDAATSLQAAFARLPRTAPSESLLARCRSADLLLRSPCVNMCTRSRSSCIIQLAQMADGTTFLRS